MKKLFTILITICIFGIYGCKSIPTEDQITGLSYAAGLAAGYACELNNVDTSVIETTLTVLNNISLVIPETNSTFVVTWTPLIISNVNKYIDAGKINNTHGQIIISSLTLVAKTVDYMFIKHPTWKEYSNATLITIQGISEGFKSVISSSLFKSQIMLTHDIDVYNYLTEHKK